MSISTPENAEVALTDEKDPLLALRGSGKDVWSDEHADEYVRRLRGSWETAVSSNPPSSRCKRQTLSPAGAKSARRR
ncbi:MAG: hypothetical protein WAO35_24245 [Terriglobia bacterium]